MGQPTRQNTKTALVRSAERLFAEKGLGTVSVKDITKAAGARNPSAVHYHFGNVEALIKEVFAQRLQKIEKERTKRLLAVDRADPKERLVAVMEAALAPFLEACLEEDGRLYVRFCVQFASDPRFHIDVLVEEFSMRSLDILQAKLASCLPDMRQDVLTARLRRGFHISLIQATDYSRQIEAGEAPPLEKVVREAALSLAGYLSAPTA